MSKRIKQAVLVLVVVFVAAQLIRPDLSSPPTEPSHTIDAALGTDSPLPAILDRGCGDCHSNNTVGGWYSQIAPFSWVMASTVSEGRKAVNFSEWAGYQPEAQRALMLASCDDARSDKMPGPYTWLRPETKLSPDDVATICAAAGKL